MNEAKWNDFMRSGQDIGFDHYIRREYLYDDGRIITHPYSDEPVGGVFVGLTENHKTPDGNWCGGWIGFMNVPGANSNSRHLLISADPLTISPSIACSSCPSHGFIREGKWMPV